MIENTFLDRSKNPNVISNTPQGAPTRNADARVEFIAACMDAIEAGNVEAMTVLLARSAGYPLMAARLRKAIG